MDSKPRILLVAATVGYVLISLGFLFGQHKGDVWSPFTTTGWFVSMAAILLHVVLYPARFDAISLAIRITAGWLAFIALGILSVKQFRLEIWTFGTLVVTVAVIFGFLGSRSPRDV